MKFSENIKKKEKLTAMDKNTGFPDTAKWWNSLSIWQLYERLQWNLHGAVRKRIDVDTFLLAGMSVAIVSDNHLSLRLIHLFCYLFV